MEPGVGISDEELPRYWSKKPAMFVVELKSGWCDRHLKDDDCKLKF